MSLLNVFSVRIVFRFKLFADFFIDIAPLTFYVKQNSGFYSTFSFNVKYICSCSLSQNTFTLINKSNNTIRTSFCGAWLFLFSPLSQIEVVFSISFSTNIFWRTRFEGVSWFQNMNSWLSISHLFAMGNTMIFWTIDTFRNFWYCNIHYVNNLEYNQPHFYLLLYLSHSQVLSLVILR